MIYYRDELGTLRRVVDWKLETQAGERIALLSEEDLRAYLEAHPDTTFRLDYCGPIPPREIEHPDPAEFGPDSPHIPLGTVRWDAASAKILSE
jgi:hypothetical protein